MKKIWFNSGYSIVQYICHKLQKNGYIIYGSHHSHKLYQYVFDEFFIESKESDLDFYINTIKEKNIDIFVPWFNLELIIQNKNLIENLTGVDIILPHEDVNMFKTINNKYYCYKFFENNEHINIPNYDIASNKTDFFSKYEEIEQQSNCVCFKPTEGVFASGFKKIINSDDVDFYNLYLNNIDSFHIEKSSLFNIMHETIPEVIILEFLDGVEYSADVVCKKGEILSFNIRKKLDSLRLIENNNDIIIKQITEIISNMELNGFINIQFLENSDGIPYLLEINPRSAGGMYQGDFLEDGRDLIDVFEQNFLKDDYDKNEASRIN